MWNRFPMPHCYAAPPPTGADMFWRTVYRTGFPLALAWWRVRRPRHRGALVAVYVGQRLLLLRGSYRAEWNFPGGGIGRGETPEQAARRELAEETGIVAGSLTPAGDASGLWDFQRDHVHFFELRLDRLPDLRLDGREILEARLVAPDELAAMAIVPPVRVYLSREPGSGHSARGVPQAQAAENSTTTGT